MVNSGLFEKNGAFDAYWMNTSNNELVFSLIHKAKPSFREKFDKFIQGISQKQLIEKGLTFTYLENNSNAIWTLLLHTGYLNALETEKDDANNLYATLSITNKEVRGIYAQIVQRWFAEDDGDLDGYLELINSLKEGNMEKFTKEVRRYIRKTASYFNFNIHTPEQVFHSFMMGILVELGNLYKIESNKQSGDGRCDILLIPKSPYNFGIILEFKVFKTPEDLEKTSHEALTQIQEKRCVDVFDSSQNVLIGMAFCGKDVHSSHIILP